jgi:hypothetical protein
MEALVYQSSRMVVGLLFIRRKVRTPSMMKKHMIQGILSAALLSVMPLAVAQEFPTTPQPETLQQAIQFEKRKDAADAAQARKEAGETARVSRSTASRTARAKSARKTGQADSKQSTK